MVFFTTVCGNKRWNKGVTEQKCCLLKMYQQNTSNLRSDSNPFSSGQNCVNEVFAGIACQHKRPSQVALHHSESSAVKVIL